ncbi:MAG TPA: molybdate ABC transporter substrate-binding protein [Usitatibacter sp.]|nr:molybdate ABC transporter substrate-binding protein [Usitatibacter sp.]
MFAAASLKESLEAAARDFEAASGHQVRISYAGSNALARQIEAGAPADVFVCADDDWIEYLAQRGLIVAGSRKALLANDLVLVAPAQSTLRVELVPGVDIAAALGGKRIALANPQAVPAGKYARAAFESLGAWRSIEARLAASDNVRGALALVARGEAPLGVVYATDARAEKAVRVVATFPARAHPPIVYSLVQVKRPGAPRPAAGAFTVFLASDRAHATFERFGFRRP